MEKGDPDLYRAAGSVAGAILPLLYVRPLNIRDALARFFFGCICGWAFYFVALDFFKWPENPNRIMAASIVAASASWFVAGALVLSWVKRAKAIPSSEDAD